MARFRKTSPGDKSTLKASRYRSVNKVMRRDEAPTDQRPVRVRQLTADDWPVIEKLFGHNGACGGCWCMWWRVPRGGKLWEESKGARNKRAFKRLVTSGAVFGCLAFEGGEPVGWCCVGPRGDFPRIERTKALRTEWDESTWSVVCFFIKSDWRGKGVATALLERAVTIARRHGAKTLEGYPVKPRGGSKMPAAFAWTGVPKLFASCGFTNVAPSGNARDIYQIRFDRGTSPRSR